MSDDCDHEWVASRGSIVDDTVLLTHACCVYCEEEHEIGSLDREVDLR